MAGLEEGASHQRPVFACSGLPYAVGNVQLQSFRLKRYIYCALDSSHGGGLLLLMSDLSYCR
jgi:hypothetical protein